MDSNRNVFTTEKIADIEDRLDKGFVISRVEKFWFKQYVRVKKEGIAFSFTDEELEEYLKCKLGVDINDKPCTDISQLKETGISYFARVYCKIRREDGSIGNFKMRPYQKDILNDFDMHRFNILMSSRQSGKTINSSIYILYYCIFNNDKNVLIAANISDTVKEIINKIKDIYYELPWFLKPGVTNWNQSQIAFGDTGCRIKTSSATNTSGVGNTTSLLFLDEFALIPGNIMQDYYSSVFPTISSLTNSKIIITSTPRGYNLFHKLLSEAELPVGDKRKNTFHARRVYWHEIEGRFVTYVKIYSEICQKYGITKDDIIKFISDMGFEYDVRENFTTGNTEIWLPSKKINMPQWFIDENIPMDSDTFLSEYLRTLQYKYDEHRHVKLIEICDVSSWKEDAIKDIGSVESFNREYGLQFSSGDETIIDAQTMEKVLNSRIDFEYFELPAISNKTYIDYSSLKWVDDISIFNKDNAKSYEVVISVDISEGGGLGGDYSVLNIFKVMPKEIIDFPKSSHLVDFFKLKQIGIFRSNTVSVQELAEILYLVVFEYFDSEKVSVVLEVNGWGSELCLKMKEMWNGRNDYSNHIFYRYKHRQEDNDLKIGIKVRKNKNMFVKEYQKRMGLGDINVHDEHTIKEVTTFIRKETKDGNIKYEAGSGKDDVAMSLVSLSTVFEHFKFFEVISGVYDKLSPEEKKRIDMAMDSTSDTQEGPDYSMVSSALRNSRGSRGYNRTNRFI
jgi:hypothetical protein